MGINYGSVPDWIAGISAAITAGIATWIGLVTLKQQKTTADIQLALNIFNSINLYWDRLTDKPNECYNYNIGQILSQFELAAMLFNREALGDEALPILKDHIIEVFTSIRTSDNGPSLLSSIG